MAVTVKFTFAAGGNVTSTVTISGTGSIEVGGMDVVRVWVGVGVVVGVAVGTEVTAALLLQTRKERGEYMNAALLRIGCILSRAPSLSRTQRNQVQLLS